MRMKHIVDKHSITNKISYLFNGKELDGETELYYFIDDTPPLNHTKNYILSEVRPTYIKKED